MKQKSANERKTLETPSCDCHCDPWALVIALATQIIIFIIIAGFRCTFILCNLYSAAHRNYVQARVRRNGDC